MRLHCNHCPARFVTEAERAEHEDEVHGNRFEFRLQPMDTFSTKDDFGHARYIAKAAVHEGSAIVVYGTNDKPIGWIDSAALFRGRVYRDRLVPAPLPHPLDRPEGR